MRVALFVTCLVDQMFPEVGVAAVRVLRRLGVEVIVPEGQTCCGQPLFNTGYRAVARQVASHFLDVFEPYECIVALSGSCTAMLRVYYRELFADDARQQQRVASVAEHLHEFSEFLVNVLGREDVGARLRARVTYHDACHLLRELRLRDEPRRLIRSVKDIDFVEMGASDSCCGFGGTFAVKFPEVSGAMVSDKAQSIIRSGAEIVVANDTSCLMQISGALRKQNLPVRTMHLAELLANQ